MRLIDRLPFALGAAALLLAAAFPVPAQDKPPVARVVSAEGGMVTLKVLSGSFVNGDAAEVFTGTGKATAKLVFPRNLDLLMNGDEVKGITLQGASGSLAGGFVAPPGKFPNFAAIQKAAGGAAASPSPAAPAPAAAAATPCPFKAAELTSALGLPFEEPRSMERPFATGRQQSCTYSPSRGMISVAVTRTIMTVGDPATNRRQMERMLAGKLEPVAGDPDGAKWQTGQGDLTGVTLHYFRNNTSTEIRVSGVDLKNAAAVSAMRAKVLKLRRP